MPYSQAQRISGHFNNCALNVALPIVLNGIEDLAKAERLDERLNIPENELHSYNLLKELFCEYYQFGNLSWQEFYEKLETNFFPGNFFAKEVILAPVLRLFLEKQIELQKSKLKNNQAKSQTLSSVIDSIEQPIEPWVNDYKLELMNKTSFKIESDGKYLELELEAALFFFYEPFAINEYTLQASANPPPKTLFIELKPNHFEVIAEVFNTSFDELTTQYLKEMEDLCKDRILKNVIHVINLQKGEYTQNMFECLRHRVNPNYPLTPEIKILYNICLKYPDFFEQYHSPKCEKIRNDRNYDPVRVRMECHQNDDTQRLIAKDKPLENRQAQQENKSLTASRENTSLQFQYLEIIIVLGVFAALALVATIIFCPPIGIAATIGISAANAWIIASTCTATSSIAGICSLFLLFKSDNKVPHTQLSDTTSDTYVDVSNTELSDTSLDANNDISHTKQNNSFKNYDNLPEEDRKSDFSINSCNTNEVTL